MSYAMVFDDSEFPSSSSSLMARDTNELAQHPHFMEDLADAKESASSASSSSRGQKPRFLRRPTYFEKSESGFVGLSNQGATCYLVNIYIYIYYYIYILFLNATHPAVY